MFRLNKKGLFISAGVLWLLTGFYLVSYGSYLLAEAIPQPVPFKMWGHPLLEMLSSSFLVTREEAALFIVAGCIATGSIKAIFILSRSVKRGIKHIYSLPTPSPFYRIYDWKYYILIAVMISFGFIMRNSGLPKDLRAACYLSIGFGMITASKFFFKETSSLKAKSN